MIGKLATFQAYHRRERGISLPWINWTQIIGQAASALRMALCRTGCKGWLCFVCYLTFAANTFECKTPQTGSCTVWLHFGSVWADLVDLDQFSCHSWKNRQTYSSTLANTFLKSKLPLNMLQVSKKTIIKAYSARGAIHNNIWKWTWYYSVDHLRVFYPSAALNSVCKVCGCKVNLICTWWIMKWRTKRGLFLPIHFPKVYR